MSRRTATVFGPDQTIEGVVAGDIVDNAIESRHVADNELLPRKMAMVESAVAIPIIIDYALVADATAGINIFTATVPFKIEILEVIVQGRANSAGGTVRLTNGTNDITNDIVCEAIDEIARAGVIDATYSTLNALATLTVIAGQAADRGLITIIAIKRD